MFPILLRCGAVVSLPDTTLLWVSHGSRAGRLELKTHQTSGALLPSRLVGSHVWRAAMQSNRPAPAGPRLLRLKSFVMRYLRSKTPGASSISVDLSAGSLGITTGTVALARDE